MALIIVAGNIGKDAEYSEKDGRGMARFSVAESEKVRGEKVTVWYNCTVFGKSAEFCRDYVKKGRSVMVTGKPSARTYRNKLEEQIATIDIVANDVKLFGSMRDGEQGQSAPANPAGFVAVENEDMPF